MNNESPTQFLERKYPTLKAIIDYTLHKIELIALTVIMSAILAYLKHDSNSHEEQLQKQIQQTATTVTNIVNFVTQ